MGELESKGEALRASIEEELKRTKPGDEIVVYTGATVTIAKVNKKSVISSLGSRYSTSEIIKIVHKEF